MVGYALDFNERFRDLHVMLLKFKFFKTYNHKISDFSTYALSITMASTNIKSDGKLHSILGFPPAAPMMTKFGMK